MKHFKIEEFKCPCCGEVHMNQEFLDKLDKARGIADTPFIITSGYRCEKHNAEVGGHKRSAHLRGYASDIKTIGSMDRYVILSALQKVGFNRFGIGRDFIHVDMDPELVSDVIWTYYK